MVNKPIQQQVNHLIEIAYKNPHIKAILDSNPFPEYENWYLGAGCVCQSVWNYLSKKEITNGIKDYDLVYYDAQDISKESETKHQKWVKKLLSTLPAEVEVVNEARVHLWFEQDFGKKIDGKVNVYATYGLNDLFGMVVRPNKPSVIRWVYEKKLKNGLKTGRI